MTQRELNSLVAKATGESRRTISQLGFSEAAPIWPEHDPEPQRCRDGYLDWDDVQSARYVPTGAY